MSVSDRQSPDVVEQNVHGEDPNFKLRHVPRSIGYIKVMSSRESVRLQHGTDTTLSTVSPTSSTVRVYNW